MGHITDAMTPQEAAKRTEDYRIHQEAVAQSDLPYGSGSGFSESDPNYWADYGFTVGVYPMGNDYED